MKDGYFSIGEVSELKGITVKALRYYDRIGLFMPCHKDASSKYRYYSIEQFAQLDIIKACRLLGISPKDIKTLLDKKDDYALIQFLHYRKNELLNEIKGLQNTVDMITGIQDNIQVSIYTANNREIYYKDLPVRNIIKSKLISANETDLRIGYAEIYKRVEKLCLNTYETGIVYSNVSGEFHPADIFALVKRNTKKSSAELTVLPAGKYLCLCLNKENAQEQTEKFNTYIIDNNLKPSLILQVDLFKNIFEQGDSYIELQALI